MTFVQGSYELLYRMIKLTVSNFSSTKRQYTRVSGKLSINSLDVQQDYKSHVRVWTGFASSSIIPLFASANIIELT